ncbi:MAG: hypothetical protein EXS14_08870 [Planctomycetes bacterium]|nr:hypothetical protein [Planctomycetota bacterium]
MAPPKSPHFWPAFGLMLAVFSCAANPLSAQETEIGLRVVAGRTFLLVDLCHGKKVIAAHLLLDLGATSDLVLHPRTAALLELNTGEALGVRVRGQMVCSPVTEVQGMRVLELLTRDYAEELQETPVVGILGACAFGNKRITLDLQRRLLRISSGGAPRPPDAVELCENGIAKVGQKYEVPWTGMGAPRFLVRGKARDGSVVEALAGITSMDHDVRVSDVLLRQLGAPLGDPVAFGFGPFELTRHAALRPESEAMPWEDAPPVVIGSAFLSCFVVSMDAVRHVTLFECVAAPEPFATDAQCFAAMALNDTARLRTWLDANAEHRLRRDAATLFFALTVGATPGDSTAVLGALRLMAESISAKRRARLVLDTVAELKTKVPEAYALIVRPALELALSFAGEDEDADAIYKVRSEIGAQLLESGDLEGAWRHLLAASLGMPRDGIVNERLGTLYERMGKTERAWSRYLQAAITADGGPGGIAGIERLRVKSAVAQPYSVDEIERMLEGRAPLFEPATVYRPREGVVRTRSVLVELFTGVHCKPCAAADLGFEGLMHHFAGGEVTLVQHHLHVPKPDALTTNVGVDRARTLGVAGTPTLLLDGSVQVNAGGPKEDAGKTFRALQAAIEERLKVDTPWRLALKPALQAGRLEVVIEVVGPDAADAQLTLLVCQRSMLMPGESSIVFHRYVSRGEIVDGGVKLRLENGKAVCTVASNLAELDGENADHQDEVEDQAGKPFALRAAPIDPAQVVVVGWLTSAGSVVQSASVELQPRETGPRR